jgi:hypothetical protein
MKHFFPLQLLLLLFLTFSANAQYAPVTHAGFIYNAAPGTVISIPVSVQNFMDIGSFQLKITYKSTPLSFIEVDPNPVLSGLSVTNYTVAGTGTIIITWSGTEGITLPDQARLINLSFTFFNGVSSISWGTDQCFYRKFTGNILLNDLPKSTFYFNGGVTNLPAPTTAVPPLLNAVPGPVTVPVIVKNFSNIGSITLKLTYDTSVLVFDSAIPDPMFGSMLIGRNPGTQFIIFQWFGSGRSLPDSSALIHLYFNFISTPGAPSYSNLTWTDNGPSCAYTDGSARSMLDLPTSDFYSNGIVTGQVSPVTWISQNTQAIPGNSVSLPVKVMDFDNISEFSLEYKFDPSVLSMIDWSVNPSLTSGGTLTVTPGIAGPDMRIPVVIGWLGNSPISLPDSTDLLVFNYDYISGSTGLDWETGLCFFKDLNNNQLYKIPPDNFFKGGLVTSRLAPVTFTGDETAILGQTVSIPVKVNAFSHIGEFKFTINIDPGVLVCQSATLVAAIGGTLTFEPLQTGQFQISWTGPMIESLPDSTTLLNLNCSFSYFGGTSAIQFSPVAAACEYREGPALPALWDQPKSSFYFNGSVTAPPQLAANIKVLLEGPYSAGLMNTILNSSGLLPLSQPYPGTPWNYPGTETVTAIPANVTDWVLVELRTSTAASSKVASAAGFVRKDGLITNLDGTSCLSFGSLTAGNYYVVIYHRNHIPVMSATPIQLKTNSALYDFTTGSSKVYGGANGCKLIDSGASRWGMTTGDGNGDGSIYVEDYTDYWIPEFGLSNVYSIGDFSMDGVVFTDDYTDFWIPNFGKSNVLP